MRRYSKTSGAKNQEELFRLITATMMVRRRKNDVLKQLPPKRRQQVASNLDVIVVAVVAAVIVAAVAIFRSWCVAAAAASAASVASKKCPGAAMKHYRVAHKEVASVRRQAEEMSNLLPVRPPFCNAKKGDCAAVSA
eukprot:scaffold60168_cov14-Tisochrysis_lutea.AAC.1